MTEASGHAPLFSGGEGGDHPFSAVLLWEDAMSVAQPAHTHIESDTLVEQRQSRRHRVNAPAWLDFLDGLPLRSGTLWDVSEAGARIVLDAADRVPREFSLVLASDGSVRRLCRVVWRLNDQIGVCYLTPPTWHWTST